MIVGLFAVLVFTGIIFGMIDIFFSFLPIPGALVLSLRMMGLCFVFIGVIVIAVRINQTGANLFVNLPEKNSVILLHSHRGKNPNARFVKGKLIDLEFIKAKRKIFKDTGGGLRICGHDVRFTHETIAHDIPLSVGQYFHQIKERYGTRNNKELVALYEKLKILREPIKDVISLEDQLTNIVELKPIMNDDVKRQELLSMGYERIKNMTETVWDGKVLHMEDVESFIESAPPNELDSLMTQESAHQLMRIKRYRDPGEINWGQWVPILLILLVGGAIAVAIIAGVFH